METGLEGINAIGIAGIIGFLLCWVGVVATLLSLKPWRHTSRESINALRSNPEFIRKFLVAFGLGLIGIASLAVTQFFGGLPPQTIG